MFMRLRSVLFCLLLVLSAGLPVQGQQKFSELVGPVSARPVQNSNVLRVPFITWGGDVATFYANGGLKTAAGSLFNKQGLNIQLTPGDDFVGQVRDYMSGKTPFLRGTYRMLGQASEVLGSSPDTKPVIILQLSWSAGDHIVSRRELKTLNDLKRSGKKVRIACQQGGPHVGLLYDSLAAAQINRSDVDIVWVPDLSGDNGPAELFRKDPSIDACCVITPDMIGLCGGMDSVGTGAEGTVEGAHVLNSTAQMSRSIADVYAVRSDWFKANRDQVEKFVAGYLAGTEATVKMRDGFETTGRMDAPYRQLLSSAQKIFGADVLPTLEVDAHGLLLDCGFVGLPGQIAFFEDKGNLSGFEATMKKALDMAVNWGYATSRSGFEPPKFDYASLAKLANIAYVKPTTSGGRIAAEALDFSPEAELDDRTIVSFTISFDPNQASFSSDRYGSEFNRAIQSASTFGNAVVVIRGHSDPTQTLRELIQAGMQKGLVKRTGQRGAYKYFLKGRPLDVKSMDKMTQLIKTGEFEGTKHKPRETMQAALNLSLARAEAVRKSLVDFAKQQQVNLDVSQMQPVGAGILEPVVPKPKSLDEARENMRVEFRIVRVPAEAIQDSDFDF
jgi:outer membrane protein OmpA-like peptidoglycan-associated protein/ABC-type nitrate/sulfonate/bicarbonate transport system substrate-binding protein